MKGLILKDLINIKGYAKTTAFMLGIFIIVSFFNSVYLTTLSFLMSFLGAMLVLSTFGYDENSKWDSYALTLPITKKEVVKSKYLLLLILLFFGSLMGVLLPFVLSIISKADYSLSSAINVQAGVFAGIIIINSVALPFIYKFGVEKGRIYLMMSVVLTGLVIGGSTYFLRNVALNFLQSVNGVLLVVVGLLVIMSIVFISYQISCRLYLKREM